MKKQENIDKLMNIIDGFSEKEIEQVLTFAEFLVYKRKNNIKTSKDTKKY